MVMTIYYHEPLSTDVGGAKIRDHYTRLGWDPRKMTYVSASNDMDMVMDYSVVICEPLNEEDAGEFLVCSRNAWESKDKFSVIGVHNHHDGSRTMGTRHRTYLDDQRTAFAAAAEEILAAYLDKIGGRKTKSGPKPWYLTTGKADFDYENGGA